MEEIKQRLINAAREVVGVIELDGFENNSAGAVGAALLSKSGKIYTGICIDTACSLGFCAEAAAMAEMLKNKETEIAAIAALTYKGNIIPPCGRCRELMYQLNKNNKYTKVIISDEKIVPLKDLLPHVWTDKF